MKEATTIYRESLTVTIYNPDNQRKQRHAIRRACAILRHVTTTPAVIILHDHTDAERDARAILEAAARDAQTALAARYRASGIELMDTLRKAVYHDMRRAGVAAAVTLADEQREQAEAIRKDAARAKAHSKRKRSTQDERDAAAALAITLTAAADAHSGQAQDINSSMTHDSHTDAADIIQEAALARWEDIKNTTAADHHRSINAAGKAVNSLAAAKGYTASRTKVKAISADDARTWFDRWPMYVDHSTTPAAVRNVPFSTASRSKGAYTVEYRNTKRFPASWYLITRYATQAPVSLDDFAKGAKDDDTASTYLDTLTALHAYDIDPADADHQPQLEALLTAAAQGSGDRKTALTERERSVLTWATDDTNRASVVAGVAAVDRYMQKADAAAKAAADKASTPAAAAQREAAIRRYYARRVEIIRSRARLEAAMKAHNVPKTARRMFKSRIKFKLEAAMTFAPYWNIITDSRAAHITEEKPLDLVSSIERWAAQQPDAEPAIRWTRRPFYMGESVTVTEAQQEAEAAADRAYHAYGQILFAISHAEPYTIDGWKNAAHAAAAFIDGWTLNSYRAGIPEERAAIDAHRQRIAAAAEAAKKEAEAMRARWERPAANPAAVAAFERSYDRWETAQKARKAAEEASAAKAADLAERRRNVYNAAIRAAYAGMNTTHAKATEEQRNRARACAEAEMNTVTE